ncbi:hypothetical protein [Enhygromyxa salina]|uniref:hypothetical protein n=1 Tax=Enhygromyxa salina TaxID=215803 RepID=UPI0015E75612|nr:hypothetical protein [Enhygromyxa salina]
MAGLPTSRRARTLLMGPLVLLFASCEGRTLPPQDDGIGFGEDELGDGDGDPDSGDGDGEPDSDDDGNIVDTGSAPCVSVVSDLMISDDTAPQSVDCVEQVLGDLTIGPTTQLISLDMLANLREVGGTIYVSGNFSLTSLEGLEQLERVDWLHVRRNDNLGDLHGLESLATVDHITISKNAGMTSLAGLPDHIAPTALEVADNDLLPSLDGLPLFSLPTTGNAIAIEIEDNSSLVDLSGLSDCCASQHASVLIDGNQALTDLDGLEGFLRLESLRLYDNLNLASLDGLENLIDVQTLAVKYDHCQQNAQASLVDLSQATSLASVNVLELEWIGSLTSLDGLEALTELSKLVVRNNASLPWADVLALESATEPGIVEICGGVGGPECSNTPCPMF